MVQSFYKKVATVGESNPIPDAKISALGNLISIRCGETLASQGARTAWTQRRSKKRILSGVGRWYWIGLVTYILILLNVVRIADRLPYQIFVLGALFNVAIITGVVVLLRRAYKKLQS